MKHQIFRTCVIGIIVYGNMGMINIEFCDVTNRRNSNFVGISYRFPFNKTRDDYLGILLVIVLLRTNPSRDEIVLDAMGQSEEVIAGRGDVTVLHQGVVKVPVEGLLKIADVLDVDDTAYRNLLPLLVIAVGQ